MLKKIIVTGGEGRFAKELKKMKSKYKFIFRNKKELNVLSIKSINNNIKKFKPNMVLHLASLSRPKINSLKKLMKIDFKISLEFVINLQKK